MQTNFNAPEFRRRLARWFDASARPLPWRNTRDPYAILVSEMMLQQTQVATVLGYYERWMKQFPDLPALAAAEEREVLSAWQGLGYYSRARNLHRTAKIITRDHGSEFPQELDAIRALPGLGRYTAGAVATFAFDRSTPIVEANIARVLARIFDVKLPVDSATGSRAIWNFAESLQPRKNAGRFNAALMELGALVCIPRNPRCDKCPVRMQCRTEDPASLPIKKPRRTTIHVCETAGFVARGERILLIQETGTRWRGLWRFPSLKETFDLRNHTTLTKLRYPITHHQVTLEILTATESEIAGEVLMWFTEHELTHLPMPSPHRRALNAILAQRNHSLGMITQRMR